MDDGSSMCVVSLIITDMKIVFLFGSIFFKKIEHLKFKHRFQDCRGNL